MKSPESFELVKPKKVSLDVSPIASKSEAEKKSELDELENIIEEVEQKREELRVAMVVGEKDIESVAVKELNESLQRARIIRRKIEGKTAFEPIISAEYKTKDEKGKEKNETIEIDFEKKFEYSISFYKKHGIEIPDDFASVMSDIWDRTRDEMQKAIEEKGFDDIIIVPGGLSIEDLHAKMSDGYTATEYGGFKEGGSFAGVEEEIKEPRIILIHKNNAQNLKDRPELSAILGKKAEDLIKMKEELTLTDYLIFQRQYFEETGKHLDESGWTWLPGSTVKNPGGGIRVVGADWSGVRLIVSASDPAFSNSSVGCRLSRCFK